MPDAEVIDITPRIEARRREPCEHRSATIDPEAKRLTCDDCGSDLDPYWWLYRSSECPTCHLTMDDCRCAEVGR